MIIFICNFVWAEKELLCWDNNDLILGLDSDERVPARPVDPV